MLSVSNLKISFEDNHVLDGFNLDLDSGDIFALLGDSGSGKSSALRFIAGLEKAQLGSVALDGNDLSSDGSHSVKPELREIGMVFQDYSLFPHMTVFDNISFGINHLSKKEKIKEVEKLLELISLEGIEKKYPHQLSGGEQQRVAVARALINQPAVIFADEPTGNLDSESSEELHQLLLQLRNEFGQTFVIVTHSKELSKISDRTIIMQDGVIS